MAALQEAAMEFIAKQPKQRKELIERAFQVFWRATHQTPRPRKNK
jgi:hypothetical protein